jgi:DUF4097 and DUF4098 domain-containing protein YvlB
MIRISMIRTLWALLLSIPLLAAADGNVSKVNGTIRIEAGQVAGDLGTVNGSITIEDGASAQEVETVNGSVTLGDRATVREIETVNGGIRMGDQAKAESIDTVNGSLKLGPGGQISGDVEAVNGSISLAKGSDIRGRVENVNGRMELDSAHVGGGLETTNGSITIGRGSRIEGGILVEKPRGTNWSGTRKRPMIVIGPDTIVQGELKFEHEVDLYVSDNAKVGPITGATAIRFSGEGPNSGDKAAAEKVER